MPWKKSNTMSIHINERPGMHERERIIICISREAMWEFLNEYASNLGDWNLDMKNLVIDNSVYSMGRGTIDIHLSGAKGTTELPQVPETCDVPSIRLTTADLKRT